MKKKIVTSVLFAALAFSAAAYTFEADGIFYDVKSSSAKTALVTYKEKNSNTYSTPEYTGSIVIPSTVPYNGDTYTVVEIGKYAFSDCETLESVVIPDGVTTIGNYAFRYCHNLKSVNLPEGIKTLGAQTFRECVSLKSIKLPSTMTSLGTTVFAYCENLESVEIPQSVTSIGNGCFWYNNALKEMTIPKSVTKLGYSIWTGCSNLKDLKVEEGNTAYKIVDGVLYTIDGTTLMQYPNARGKSYTVPEGVTTINNYAFAECEIDDLTLPSTLTTINNLAFQNCRNLTSFTFGKNLTKFAQRVFEGCTSMKEFIVEEGNTMFCSNDGILSNLDKTTLVSYPLAKATKVVIPDCYTLIHNYAFSGSTEIEEIQVNTNMENINNFAFFYCFGLKNLILPSSVKSIGIQSIFNCTSLERIEFPEGFTTIGNSSLATNPNLREVVLPSTLKTIQSSAFVGDTGLTDVYCHFTTPITPASNAFGSLDLSKVNLHVDPAAVEAFKENTIWSQFNIIGDLPAGVADVLDNETEISVSSGNIVIKSATNTPVEIFSTNGQLLYSGNAQSVPMPCGIYVVKAGDTTSKVVVK